MLRGIGWLLSVLLLALGCWWIYHHVKSGSTAANGDVFTHTEPSDSKDRTEGDESAAKDGTAPFSQPAVAALPAAVAVPAPTATTASPAAGVPASDSVAPNPVNGMAFGGSGKYQWYRQGNLTWRIDTHTGASCIDFATKEEWSKQVVYSHACGRA